MTLVADLLDAGIDQVRPHRLHRNWLQLSRR